MSACGLESGISPTQNQSSPFSISDILSNEVGQKKSPTTSCHNISFSIPGSTFSTPGSNTSFSTPGSSSAIGRISVYSLSGQENANQKRQANRLETPKRPRKGSNSGYSSVRPPHITLSDTGTLVPSSSGPTYTENLRIQGSHESHIITPYNTPRFSQINSSFVSPFNANVLLALGQRPSPNSEEKEELFGDTSLGMLSEVAVAQYHSELSGAEGNSGLETPMRERLANIRLVSMTDDRSHEASKGEAANASLNVRTRKILTPSILKRDKRRRLSSGSPAQSSSGNDSTTSSSRSNHAHLNAGFLSPLANEKSSSNKDLTFSPSIFLSRPDHFISSPEHVPTTHSSVPVVPIPRPDSYGRSTTTTRSLRLGSSSPGSESDCPPNSLSDMADNGSDSFVTSTPIKGGKENVKGRNGSEERWSPTILHSKRQKHLTSGGEPDPVKKPCLPPPQRRKSKARTKLSPLLENACSPITKDTFHRPSPLTTALATTPTKDVTMNLAYQVPANPPIPKLTLPLSSTPHLPSSCQPSIPMAAPHPGFIGSSAVTHPSPVENVASLGQKLFIPSTTAPLSSIHRPFTAGGAAGIIPLSQAHQNLFLQRNPFPKLQASFSYNPLAFPGYIPFMNINPPNYLSYPSGAQFVALNRNSDTGGGVMSRSSFNEGKRDGQIQSVPPWFIFSNNRSEKRSRLTEAINKSLSETPSQSQTTKLPAEWTKVACGQTNDQRLLTEKARVFLQCRPRQLNFCGETD